MKQEALNRYVDEGGDINISFCSGTISSYRKQGYRKMTENEASAMSSIFGMIPREIIHQVYDTAVHKSFDDAVQGSLIAVLKPGTYMPMSKTIPGALSNVGLSIETNKAGVGNPVFYKNNAVLNTPAGPQIAMSILNAVSFAVGQYNMVQINGSLKMIQSGVEEIMDFLKSEQKAKLQTAIQIYERVCKELKYAIGDERRLNDLKSQIYMTVLPTAMDLINFSFTQIDKITGGFNSEDKLEVIEKNIQIISEIFSQYKVATLLYEKALQLLYYLSQAGAPDEIEDLYLAPLKESAEKYEKNSERWFKRMRKYIHSCKALNGRSAIRNVVSIGSSAIVTLVSPKAGIKTFGLVDALFEDDQQKKKTNQQVQAAPILQDMLEFETIDAPYQSVQLSLKSIKEGIKVIKIGDEFYTNLPQIDS